MAIALDTATAVQHSGNTAFNTSHTVSGSDRVLLVAVSSSLALSGITYNSVALSSLITVNQTYLVNWYTSIWFLVAPATGTNTLTVTPGAGAPHIQDIIISSWTGVDQSTPYGTLVSTNQENQSNASISVVASSASGEMVVDAVSVYNKTLTQGGSQTVLGSIIQDYPGIGSSYQAGAASTTMTWSWGGGQISSIAAIPLKPVSAGASFIASPNKPPRQAIFRASNY